MNKNFENNDFNSEPNKFGLPENYFQNSAEFILNKIDWIDEHKEFKKLGSLKKESGFIVPENYFENIESRLELLEYPNISVLKKLNPFIVPKNYFENSSALLNVPENELQEFEKLNSTKKQNSFIVSENYFSESEQKITSQLIPSAKVIRLFSAKVWYSAVAAVLTITLGLWIYTQYFKPVDKDCTSLACITKADLMEEKTLENIDNDDLYELVDTKKLKNNLDSKSDNKKDKKINDTLKDVSTDDLPDEI